MSLKLGKEAECKDEAPGTVINRWLGKFHISSQKSPPALQLGRRLPDRKGDLNKEGMEIEKVWPLFSSKR